MRESKIHMRTLIIILIAFLNQLIVFGQVDTGIINYQKAFNDFNTQIKNDFNGFQSKNDSLFYGFLNQAWQEYSLFLDQPEINPKPKQQPVYKEEIPQEIKIIYDQIIDKSEIETHEIFNDDPGRYMKMKNLETSEVNFHGLPLQFPQFVHSEKTISNTEQDAAQFYKDFSAKEDINLLIQELSKIKSEYILNDWAFLELLNHTAEVNFSKKNERILFIWFILVRQEYQVKLGYFESDLYLLLNFSTPVYYRPYLRIEQSKYYVFMEENEKIDLKKIHTYAMNHPNQHKALTLAFSKLPKFPEETVTRNFMFEHKTIYLSYNYNLTEFYKNYPLTELSIYLKSPLSEVAKQKLGEYIEPLIQNMSAISKINFLLHFIQYSFPYQNDMDQFSKEKYMFAEESLSFPYTDCEDRVILLDKLVKEYTDLKTIVLLYPYHVVLGIENENIKDAAFVQYKGNNYYIADPTYLGAGFGMLMNEYEDVNPKILAY